MLPKYARLERERRFRVPDRNAVPAGPERQILDRYLDGGRLRLRRVENPDGSVIYKLGKKYGLTGFAREPITNVYLDETEYQSLLSLPGQEVRKRRRSVSVAGRTWAVDAFEGALAGLVIAEVDVERDGEALVLPSWVGQELTGLAAWSGWSLARLDQPPRS